MVSREMAVALGLKYYFTGTPCAHGHACDRRVRDMNCVECARDRLKDWRRRNPGKQKEHARKWYASNRVRLSKKYAHKYSSRRDEIRARRRRYYSENREAELAKGRERYAKRRGAIGTHTAADVRAILKAQRNRCAYCPADLRRKNRHVDHIVPLARGGSNDRKNLQLLCQTCNLKKGAKDPLEFSRQTGRLL